MRHRTGLARLNPVVLEFDPARVNDSGGQSLVKGCANVRPILQSHTSYLARTSNSTGRATAFTSGS
jgi:hypothetical protein